MIRMLHDYIGDEVKSPLSGANCRFSNVSALQTPEVYVCSIPKTSLLCGFWVCVWFYVGLGLYLNLPRRNEAVGKIQK